MTGINENLDTEEIQSINDVEVQTIISVQKFIVLSFLSFGAYMLWWIYKAWKFFQQKDDKEIMPAARAIFSIIFLIPLMNDSLDYAKSKGYTKSYSSVALYFGFIAFNLASKLPDPFWLISTLSCLFIIPTFQALTFAKLNATEFTVQNQTEFNGRQVLLIVIGIVFWALVLIGLNLE